MQSLNVDLNTSPVYACQQKANTWKSPKARDQLPITQKNTLILKYIIKSYFILISDTESVIWSAATKLTLYGTFSGDVVIRSTYIECILPSINGCPVCDATLLSSVQDLGTTANNAVFTPAVNFEADQQSDDEINNDEDIDDSDNDVERTEVEENEIPVDQLLQKISLWRRSDSALLWVKGINSLKVQEV